MLAGILLFLVAVVALMVWAVRGRSARLLAPSVWRGPRTRRAIALTFDDGPSESTPYLLALLAKHRAKATFFVGKGNPDLPGMGIGATHNKELRFNNFLLTDSCNPTNNPYNSTINTNVCDGNASGGTCRTNQYSVDLDTFDVSSDIALGDSTATVNGRRRASLTIHMRS